ncbi:geranylgeranyl diphosphate reductase [Pararhodospirillum photometricum]|uniref:geranylgeranyl diphosphate reductase n=1 Tax=Pararhodospirillum photometricum DSM 122 TaxID=1150469 RepID=H6SIQ0_PARPM|nr:geranylgeranyl diphosphate reductase [Pararhodospirillum photometricum]CCG06677.1 Geranylgeranyl reductase BchP [Pararhodospirillum photometricum DSM 122]
MTERSSCSCNGACAPEPAPSASPSTSPCACTCGGGCGGTVDVVVVGGGPAGATAARDLALAGFAVVLLDREGRIKPCGGAIPPRAMRDFDIPEAVLCAKVHGARMVAPSGRVVLMPIGEGYVGMVDRQTFDPWLRERAATAGARRVAGTFRALEREDDGTAVVVYRAKDAAEDAPEQRLRTRAVIGADGALSLVARAALPDETLPTVAAYHEIVRTPAGFDASVCDVWYQGRISPDFYGWVFPHGDTISVGVGTEVKGFSLRDATRLLRDAVGLSEVETLRSEGAPIPLRPRKRWDNGRDVLLAGDAAGVVAPSSGEGIYYALESGRQAARAVERFLKSGNPACLGEARRRFLWDHGLVFWILEMMQRFWYVSDERRERFVALCADPTIQRMTWDAYMNKRLSWRDPVALTRIFFKNIAHLLGLVRV